MDDGVAVWANWSQVIYWIDFVIMSNVGEWPQVVNVYKASSHLTVRFNEVEPTHDTVRSIMVNALSPRFWITLVSIDRYRSFTTFK